MQLNEEITIDTIKLLTTKYELPKQFIDKLLDENGLNNCELTLNKQLTNKEKLKLLLGALGSQFFSTSVELRKRVIANWPTGEINKHFDIRSNTSGNTLQHKIRILSELKWHNGKSWANTFVKTSGLNLVFAGLANDQRKPRFEDIEPIIKPPQLKEFQLELKDALIKTLNEKGDKAKCMISLPTGGGKTRTAVEAFVEWLQPRFAEGKYLIWLAQSEELCEQAIASISQVWSSKEFSESLRVYRFFGSNTIDLDDLCGGVLVCTINKLYNSVNSDDEFINEIISHCGALIIDEAHRATSPMYESLYLFSKKINGEDMFPICGLTATPGRIDTSNLSRLFQYNLITPNLGSKYEENPLEYFRENNFLAKPIHKEIQTKFSIGKINIEDSNGQESIINNLELHFKKTLNKDLAKDVLRNILIIETLRNIPRGQQTLVYACTVDHAVYLSSIMNFYGKSSVVVSSDTRKPLRRKYIDQFKKGEIDFIFNYGVLTTGFDAPKTENIVICRPTFSDVLYEQIVGRGLRGVKFGGTEFCTIIDFCDNYQRFGDQQAYNRFKHFWVKEC